MMLEWSMVVITTTLSSKLFLLRGTRHSMAYLGVMDGLHLQKHSWDRVYALFLFVWEIPRSLFDYM